MWTAEIGLDREEKVANDWNDQIIAEFRETKTTRKIPVVALERVS